MDLAGLAGKRLIGVVCAQFVHGANASEVIEVWLRFREIWEGLFACLGLACGRASQVRVLERQGAPRCWHTVVIVGLVSRLYSSGGQRAGASWRCHMIVRILSLVRILRSSTGDCGRST